MTAQHRQMLDQCWTSGRSGQVRSGYHASAPEPEWNTARALAGLEAVLQEEKPDLVLVHGDTLTTFAGAIAAFYERIAVGHVEAGLRTFDKYFPFPEEVNRRLTGALADLHFSPTSVTKPTCWRRSASR